MDTPKSNAKRILRLSPSTRQHLYPVYLLIRVFQIFGDINGGFCDVPYVSWEGIFREGCPDEDGGIKDAISDEIVLGLEYFFAGSACEKFAVMKDVKYKGFGEIFVPICLSISRDEIARL